MIYLLLLLLFFTMQVPIVPYGGATSIEGHTLAPHGGVCIDMSLMKVSIFYFFASVHYPIFEIFKKCITLVLLSCLEYDWNLTSDIFELPIVMIVLLKIDIGNIYSGLFFSWTIEISLRLTEG